MPKILMVVGLMVWGQWSFAARPLAPAEHFEIRKAIALIGQFWPGSNTESDLRRFYVQGQIFAEDHWPANERGRTTFPIVGVQTITVQSGTIPNLNARKYSLPLGHVELFEDRALLASVLVHEWFHTTQSWAQAKFMPWTVEKPAWIQQREFLNVLLKRYQDNSYYRDRLEFLIDRVTSEINGEE
jgi:hypothetical protein